MIRNKTAVNVGQIAALLLNIFLIKIKPRIRYALPLIITLHLPLPYYYLRINNDIPVTSNTML